MTNLIKFTGLAFIVIITLAILAGSRGKSADLRPPVVQNIREQVAGEQTSAPDLPSELPQASTLPIRVVASPENQVIQSPSPIALVKVARVISGDTIELANGQQVKYEGINVSDDECLQGGTVTKNQELVANKMVRIEPGEDGKASYVFSEDGTLINIVLVQEGLARIQGTATIKYTDQLKKAEQEAQLNQRGIWSRVCATITGDNVKVNINQKINTDQSVNSSTKIKVSN